MATRCAQCGALQIEGMDCQAIHEFQTGYDFDPDSAVPHATHFLQVTCFMVQHERYSDEALAWAQTMLRAHLDADLSPRELRRFVSSQLRGSDFSTRSWRFNRAPDARPLPKIAWEVTVVDVYQQMGREAPYAELAQRWGRATLTQMVGLLA
ncbi:MAG TPA: DUF5946 family protein [Ktedonobacterales bacterium]